VARRVDGEVRLDADRLVHAQALNGTVQRHLRAIEAHRKALRRGLVRELAEPVRPLNDADGALDQRHVEQLIDAL
jgi:hypothetical protein